MSVKEFVLPDLGEGLIESEVVAWKVAIGDTVELNQIIAEVETAKALVEVPSPFAGVVRELYAEPGQTLNVGAPLMAFDVDDAEGADDDETDAAQRATGSARVPEAVAVGTASEASGRPVVSHADGRPVLRGEAANSSGRTGDAAGDASGDASGDAAGDGTDGAPGDVPRGGNGKSVGVEQREERHEVLVGRGPRQQSSTRPHRRARSGRLSQPIQRGLAGQASADTPHPTDGVAAETRAPATGLRRRTAEAMVRSAAVPQVTEFLTVDVTRGIRLLDRLAVAPELRGRRVTVLTLTARALCVALAATPEANTRWDDATGEIVTPGSVNLGIAVATERGLVVPNIRGAENLRIPELADAIASLVERARAGRATPAEFVGGTITITNVGVFGVDAGTPLLNPGETAILAMGAVNRRPWEHKGGVRLRHVMTLSLTFDHRVIDGEQGSRLLCDVGRALSDPASALAVA